MKLLAVPVVVGVAAFALGGTTRFLAHRRASPWVAAAQAREAHRRDAWVALTRELSVTMLRQVGDVGSERLFVLGPFRVAWGERLRVAVEPARERLYDATRVRDGWIFLTEAGGLLRSDDFLGPLRQMELPHRRCPSSGIFQPSYGRAVVVSSDAIFASDGGAFTRLDRSLPLRAAAFGSASWGLGLARGGRLVETRDGGESWVVVPSVAAQASALAGLEGRIWYFTDDWYVLRPDGGTSRAPHEGLVGRDDSYRILRAIEQGVGDVPRSGPRPACAEASVLRTPILELQVAVEEGSTRFRPLSNGARDPGSLQVRDAAVIEVHVVDSVRDSYRVRWRARGGTVHEHVVSRGASPLTAWAATEQGVLMSYRGLVDGIFRRVWLSERRTELTDRRWVCTRGPDCSVASTDDGWMAWDSDYTIEDGGDVRRGTAVNPEFVPFSHRLPALQCMKRLSLHHCTPAGCTRAGWFDNPRQNNVVGALREGNRWGVLAVERGRTEAGQHVPLRFVATPGFERAVAALEGVIDSSLWMRAALAPCGQTIGPWEIHTVSASNALLAAGRLVPARGPDPGFTREIHHAVFEFNSERICLRRLDAHPGESTAVSAMLDRPRPPVETSWLEARDGQLVGGRDDGNTITELRGQITPE